jgi:diaminopimelate epimerase
MSGVPFVKMQGLGNDFVVLDARTRKLVLDAAAARRIADRHTGVGCDQILVLDRPRDGGTVRLAIRNADGSEAASCGNGARCIALLLFEETGRADILMETASGPVPARRAAAAIEVDMGPARLGWREIPLALAVADTLHLPAAAGPLADPVGVGMGNPHAVFFVPDAEAVDLERWGPAIERHPLFPERTNVEVASLVATDRIRMRVWERGAGITRACGSGAGATLVAAVRRGLVGRRADLDLDGGRLAVEWRESDGHVLLAGPAAVSFTGVLDPALLAEE